MSIGVHSGFPTLETLVALLADRVAERVAEVTRRDTTEEPWRLLTLAEAAERLTRSERWVRDRVKSGELDHVRLDGGAYAFELQALQAFVEARRVGEDVDSLAGRLQATRKTASEAGSNGRSRRVIQKVAA